ncbi:hypothetical protein QE152_g35086 [Popillia japonica]|uniref:Retrotransposon gag domain-containing protein n=1 Tax=Popillia japonica TaxID=7064 RepID=A0AAW1ISR1_POPJA
MIQEKDRELEKLRQGNINTSNNHHVNVPFSEIKVQIPEFTNETDEIDVDECVKRVVETVEIYQVDDKLIKVLATNKLGKNVKKWYESDEENYRKGWTEFVNDLREMFKKQDDIGKLMDRMRNRKKHENIEHYYHEKCALAKRMKMTGAECIHHIIDGIDNFTIRAAAKVTHDRKVRKCGVCGRRGQVKKKLFVTRVPKPNISLSFVEREKKLPVSDVKNVRLNFDISVTGLVNPDSSDCTSKATLVSMKGLEVVREKVDLKSFGPSNFKVTSPGYVLASVIIDDVEAKNVYLLMPKAPMFLSDAVTQNFPTLYT